MDRRTFLGATVAATAIGGGAALASVVGLNFKTEGVPDIPEGSCKYFITLIRCYCSVECRHAVCFIRYLNNYATECLDGILCNHKTGWYYSPHATGEFPVIDKILAWAPLPSVDEVQALVDQR